MWRKTFVEMMEEWNEKLEGNEQREIVTSPVEK
jgi:hypothetical protein